MANIFLVLHISVWFHVNILQTSCRTWETRKIFPILHSPPLDNNYITKIETSSSWIDKRAVKRIFSKNLKNFLTPLSMISYPKRWQDFWHLPLHHTLCSVSIKKQNILSILVNHEHWLILKYYYTKRTLYCGMVLFAWFVIFHVFFATKKYSQNLEMKYHSAQNLSRSVPLFYGSNVYL